MELIYVKAIHIIFVVSWFAGLFYLVRLFVYHTEAFDKEPTVREILVEQFTKMERLLMYAITMPAMVITLLSGVWMVLIYSGMYGQLSNNWLLINHWMHAKLGLVFFLVLYHFHCVKIMKQLAAGTRVFSSKQFRMYNEVATTLLVAVVFLVVTKQIMPAVWAVVSFVLFAVFVFVTIRLIRGKRRES